MAIKNIAPKNGFSRSRAQAMVEFAIALPILLALIVGVMEVGRIILMYSLVVNASRDAVRYGSAAGLDSTGTYTRYKYCDGIKASAKSSGYFLHLQDSNISIGYDHGPSTSVFATCTATGGEDSSVVINTCAAGSTCDRVKVTVQVTYNPIVKLIPIKSFAITSTSYRTIIGVTAVP